MFTRHVQTTVKTEKIRDFSTVLRTEILPILTEQPGFVDLLTLISDTNTGECVSISFWKTKEDAERYEREAYTTVLKKLKPLLATPTPRVTTFNVDTSTAHNIAAGMAA